MTDSIQAFDKKVLKHCRRFSAQRQAKTGYYTMAQFESAYNGMWKNPAIQYHFGVPGLEHRVKSESVLRHTEVDQDIGNVSSVPARESVVAASRQPSPDEFYAEESIFSPRPAHITRSNARFLSAEGEGSNY